MILSALVFLCPPATGDGDALALLVGQVRPSLRGRVMVIYQADEEGVMSGRRVADALGVTWREERGLLNNAVSKTREREAITCVTEGRETDCIVLVVSPEWVARLGKRIVQKSMLHRASERIPSLQAGQAHIIS